MTKLHWLFKWQFHTIYICCVNICCVHVWFCFSTDWVWRQTSLRDHPEISHSSCVIKNFYCICIEHNRTLSSWACPLFRQRQLEWRNRSQTAWEQLITSEIWICLNLSWLVKCATPVMSCVSFIHCFSIDFILCLDF